MQNPSSRPDRPLLSNEPPDLLSPITIQFASIESRLKSVARQEAATRVEYCVGMGVPTAIHAASDFLDGSSPEVVHALTLRSGVGIESGSSREGG